MYLWKINTYVYMYLWLHTLQGYQDLTHVAVLSWLVLFAVFIFKLLLFLKKMDSQRSVPYRKQIMVNNF